MVTCGRQPFNMLPMAPMNPFVVGLATPTAMAAASRGEPVAPAAAAAAAPTSTATTTATTPPTKPKLAFSIDSIVGNERERRRGGESPGQRPPSPLDMQRRSVSPAAERCESRLSVGDEAPLPLELRNTPAHPPRGFLYCRRPSSLERAADRERGSPARDRCRSRSPPPQIHIDLSRSPTPNGHRPPTPGKGPIMVPGIPAALLRPALALQHAPPLPQNVNARSPMEASPTIPLPRSSGDAPPPPLPAAPMPPGLPGAPQLGPPPPTNPHFLAAQFQMAAALAHHHHQQQQQQQQQQQHQQHQQPHHLPPHHPHVQHPHMPGHLPPGHPMAIFPPGPHAHFAAPHLIRDSYPLYPWLLSRHGRIFPHRFPGNFLLQPFRKPKRVRTAFSPTQLLKLEHAFEGNHYVVGAERKQLAQGLSLTETQVKVWFQNRRTKHKRMQQEGDSDSKSNKGSTAGDHDGKNDSSRNSFEDGEDEEDDDELAEDEEDDEDELIDMDDDYGPAAGDELDEHQMREQFQQQLQQHHMQQQHQLQQQQQQQHSNQQHLMLQHQLYLQQQQQQQQQQQHSHAKPPPPQN